MSTSTHVLAAVSFEQDGLSYTLTPDQGRKAVVEVRLAEHPEALPHTDRVDLVAHKVRLRFAREIGDHFGRKPQEVFGHLVVLLDRAERAGSTVREPEQVELDERRREAALTLLRRPSLLDDVAGVMEKLGHVGEERTKRLVYLVATSRLLLEPLSAITTAPSGCGKSRLLEAVEVLLPREAVLYLSRLSGQALYYMGPDALRHKLVLIDEQAGATDADYSIRTLQTKGFLTLRVAGKGEVRVNGPISLMSGTTSSDLNPENLSRCLELALDDSPEQTRRVQAAQRRAWAGKRREAVDLEPWQDAQRLLEPLRVQIPFAEALTFPARTTHDRRGNLKLLGLVAAHALLHQHQRARDQRGWLQAEPEDYAAVHALLQPLLAEDLDGLSPRAAKVYRWLAEHGRATRREIQAGLGCAYNTAKRGLAELVAQELVSAADAGPPAVYRVLDGSVLGTAGELLAPEALDA
ncbi:MAG: hypothetical protein AB7N76_35010 [Planctomycetota bacterium]